MNFADINRKQNQQSMQNAKAVQELNASFLDRENKVNGYAGSAADIIARVSPTNGNIAIFGHGGTTAGP